jgi:hypothetical protein
MIPSIGVNSQRIRSFRARQRSLPWTGSWELLSQTIPAASGFFPGDKILNTNGFKYYPITITFDTPVFGAGAYVDDDLTITGFTASISAYNGDTLLGVFSKSGSGNGFGTVPFLGVLDDTAEITRVVFEITDTGPFTPLDMAISAVALNDGAAAVPEPGTSLLLAAALLLATGFRNYSKR